MQNQPSGDTIFIEDETLRAGFAQVPNRILRMRGLSHGARLTYALLLSYAWQKGSCFPGQERLAADLDVSRQSVSTYLRELKERGLIIVQRRGLGKTNIYILPRLPDEQHNDTPPDVKPILHPDAEQSLHPVVNAATHLDVQSLTQTDVNLHDHKEYKEITRKDKKIQQNGNDVAPDGHVVTQLISHGITPAIARKIVDRYPDSYVLEKCAHLEHLVRIASPQVRRNPAGYLRRAIEEDYAAPADYAAHAHIRNTPAREPQADVSYEEAAEDIPEVAATDGDHALGTQLDTLLAADPLLRGTPYTVYFKDFRVERAGSKALIRLRHSYAIREAKSRYKQRCLHLLRRIDPQISDLDFDVL